MQDKLADAMSPFEKRFESPSDGSIILFENTSSTIRSPKKTNIVSINSVLRYCLTSSLDTPCTQEEVGLKTCSSRTGTNSRRTSLPKSTSKDSSRQNSFVFLADGSFKQEEHVQHHVLRFGRKPTGITDADPLRLRLQATSRMIRLTKMSSLKQNVTIS